MLQYKLICTQVQHAPSDPLALLNWSHHLSGYKEGMHQNSSVLEGGGGMKFANMSEQLSHWQSSNDV
ncbi:hypothetical protein AMELA_G00048940 [Ameiurus melas]|uniref:Uncharacterized protein n=1 Tax=Ameiurus melas TaxID=219545 RepID=A0A7J6B6U1_AMEME|nr:hypothetical protein AMELA_G00048940 [Ameiurus melas]